MNRMITTLLLMILLPVLHVLAQQTETDIAAIRATFKKINALSLKPVQFKYESEGCVEDGTVQYYLQGKEIVKIIESGSIGDGSWKNEYYYQNGKFIFSYEMIVGGPAEGAETKSEYRVYVKDAKVIRYMEGQQILTPDSRVSKTMEIAGKLPSAYTTKNFVAILCE